MVASLGRIRSSYSKKDKTARYKLISVQSCELDSGSLLEMNFTWLVRAETKVKRRKSRVRKPAAGMA